MPVGAASRLNIGLKPLLAADNGGIGAATEPVGGGAGASIGGETNRGIPLVNTGVGAATGALLGAEAACSGSVSVVGVATDIAA
jgi:hypothetical protein